MKKIQKEISLENFITLKTRSTASFFVVVDSVEELKDAILFAKNNKLKIFILGGGSNVFFRERYDGLVIKINIFNKEIISKSEEDIIIKASSGELWDEFVSFCISKSAFGLENLSGIPGTVGASVVQNIGAYGIEIKDYVEYVEVIDTSDLNIKNIKRDDLSFAYRDSLFKKEGGRNFVVLSVVWRLKKEFNPNISYKDLAIYFEDDNPKSAEEIRNAVLDIRSKKFPDLKIFGTAGSFFKNIIVGKKDLDRVVDKYPDLVFFEISKDNYKISSAWVLDKVCGLKGFREGNVGLFINQPIVLVNYGGGSALEVDCFAKKIEEIVFEKTGLSIEREVILA